MVSGDQLWKVRRSWMDCWRARSDHKQRLEVRWLFGLDDDDDVVVDLKKKANGEVSSN